MASTSLYRTTKTRNARSQQQLKSDLLKHKYSNTTSSLDDSSHQTYGIPLSISSVRILLPIVSGLTGRKETINTEERQLYTIGIWREDVDNIYRCCFKQPEISSAMCSFPASLTSRAQSKLDSVCVEIPFADPCSLERSSKLPQLKGRMVPYVTDSLPTSSVSWNFANISRSYLMFLKTSCDDGQTVLIVGKDAVHILKYHFPNYSACVYDIKTNSYKITVSPLNNIDSDTPNKNTCMLIYGDGSFRLQGKPCDMERVCASVKVAITSVMSSPSSNSFLNTLTAIS